MLRINKQGFTLIELMVVIVIIGVLASLAIPRFTEASAKAKAAEAPRVLASYESAMLAMVAEGSISSNNLIFKAPSESKWFDYIITWKSGGNQTDATTGNITLGDDRCAGKVKTGKKIGSIGDASLLTSYDEDTDLFAHWYEGTDGKKLSSLVPNFDAKSGDASAAAADALEAAKESCSRGGGTWSSTTNTCS